MRIEIHRDGAGYKVLAIKSQGIPALLEGGLPDLGKARQRAIAEAAFCGWQVFNRVDGPTTGPRPYAGTAR